MEVYIHNPTVGISTSKSTQIRNDTLIEVEEKKILEKVPLVCSKMCQSQTNGTRRLAPSISPISFNSNTDWNNL